MVETLGMDLRDDGSQSYFYTRILDTIKKLDTELSALRDKVREAAAESVMTAATIRRENSRQ